MWTMTEVLFGKKTSMGGGEEECATKYKDEKKNKSWGWRGGESVELPLRSWETSKKMNSPLCFLCTD